MVQTVLLAAMVFYWRHYLGQNWQQLRTSGFTFEWQPTLLAGLVILAGYILLGVLWAPLCREIGCISLSPAQAFRVSSIAGMGRYLPGKVWSVAGKIYLTAPDRSQAPAAGIAAGLESVWFQGSGLLLALMVLPFTNLGDLVPVRARGLSAGILLLCVLAVHPRIFCPVANLFLRLIRRPPLPGRPRYSMLLLLMAGYMAVFAFWSTGFALFAGSVMPVGLEETTAFWAITPMAWAAGFFSLFAPAGLGVRDSVLALGLGQVFPARPAAILVVVAGTRALTTLAEFACFALALAQGSPRRPAPAPAGPAG
ncbi:MAG: hypothetical protein ACE5HD_00940 [Acidobacteriota bacterium]